MGRDIKNIKREILTTYKKEFLFMADIEEMYAGYILAHNNFIQSNDSLDYVAAGQYFTEAKKIKNRIMLKELQARGFKYDFDTELFIEA